MVSSVSLNNPTMYFSSGTVPIPLIFAAFFDNSCLVWQEACGQVGSCWIYDSEGNPWHILLSLQYIILLTRHRDIPQLATVYEKSL